MHTPIRIKTFQAPSLAQALERVRAELGPDAMILETKETPASRFSLRQARISVTASSTARSSQEPQPTSSDVPTATASPLAASAPDTAPEPAQDAIVAPNKEAQPGPPNVEGWFSEVYLQVAQELSATDLAPEQIRHWLEAAKDRLGPNVQDPWVIRSLVAQWVRESVCIDPPTQAWNRERTVVALVGASGQGKTSTVAKLAALASLEKQMRPSVFSLAEHPMSHRHPLEAYCQLMDWRFEQIIAPKCVDENWGHDILARHAMSDLILVDTSSVPFGDREGMESLNTVLAALGANQIHLTLSAELGAPHVRRTLNWYYGLAPTHLLLTKMDESLGLSSIYPSLVASHLPLGFVSSGPRVPADLLELDPPLLVRMVLGD